MAEDKSEEKITYREISLYLLGEASDSVRERINADVKRPDSQVMAFLEWMGDPDSNIPEPPADYKPSRTDHKPSRFLRSLLRSKPADDELSR